MIKLVKESEKRSMSRHPNIGDIHIDISDQVLYIYVGEGKEPQWYDNMEESPYSVKGWIIASNDKETI